MDPIMFFPWIKSRSPSYKVQKFIYIRGKESTHVHIDLGETRMRKCGLNFPLLLTYITKFSRKYHLHLPEEKDKDDPMSNVFRLPVRRCHS